MKHKNALTLILAGLVSTWPLAPGKAQTEQKPKLQMPEPGVPQIMTLEGKYVRAAYNNEGYVILGYQVANHSIGQEWMLLEVGATVREGVPSYTLTRDTVSLSTPDGNTIALASLSEYRKANLSALEARTRVQRDSINYFPPSATDACRIGFFADLSTRAMAWDVVELNYQMACLGRLFFHVPGGISYGQHWLNVQFKDSLVRVPFRILTEEEEEELSKNFKDIRKQVEEAFKKKS
ncbi:MAG TPA: hypothetical protein VLK65_04675 [Vicinamibacteria bacterium]|nr:hypothetical protein [Vicinamibacteria bacterium]